MAVKIKRYLDKDMRQVLRRVREDQGPDAVILSNRRVAGGIELIAALDYDEALVRHALGVSPGAGASIDNDALARIAVGDIEPPAIESEPAPEVVAAELVSRPPGAPSDDVSSNDIPAATAEQSLKGMRDEISSLRDLLETQLSGLLWKNAARRSPLRAQVLRNLARIGLAPDTANLIVNRLEPVDNIRDLWHTPLMTVAQTIPVSEDQLMSDGGVFALIGPTGVGKTTTIAKIAAQYAMRHRQDDVALISADPYRIGAKEHLAAFANIMGVKVHPASSSAELAETLERLGGKKLVLIDTEGRSPRDKELADRLAAYGEHQDRVRFYLTLSAASQEAGLDEAVRRFRQVPLEGCVVTKIDEAGQLGCILSTLVRHDLPAVWLSDGQRIPEDIHPAARKRLWLVNQAVESIGYIEPRVDERTMAERYAQASMANA
jgi:flagellar biosynthesis protein FlhF